MMNSVELNKQLSDYHSSRYRSWGKIIAHLKRSFDAWAVEELGIHGYKNFKMGYMPLIMNIGPEGITNNELAKKARISKQAMSKIVKELTDGGYIRMETHVTDKRSAVIYLTTQGKKLVISSRSRVEILEAEYEKLLGKKKFADLKSMLCQIMDYNEEKTTAI